MMRNIYHNSMSITSSPPEKEGTKDVEDFSSLGIWTPPNCNFKNESHSNKTGELRTRGGGKWTARLSSKESWYPTMFKENLL